ncbi:uncharacterized protein DSM5745_03231 [Aspergillus mulundensis]|uniref:Uncharacterized protein n=1 Tax=Aspergillus mulundensis TaxID=1810919 RepID=A0A3D8SJR8_9EURO|nr:hypothetical protein DSM5745_03231 [Aspergillus mulundensis]RDW86589.1 hypothetical protein DSM5745_03231 [Aspergillus mulundensis]
MTYKSNYEPYTSQSLYSRPSSSSSLLYPLGDLYPHVVALQLQIEEDENASKNSGYHQDIAYWAEVAASPSSPHTLPDGLSKRSLRRYSGTYPNYPIRPVGPEWNGLAGPVRSDLTCSNELS